MCVILVCPGNVRPDRATLDACHEANPHGAGVAWRDDGAVLRLEAHCGRVVCLEDERAELCFPQLLHRSDPLFDQDVQRAVEQQRQAVLGDPGDHLRELGLLVATLAGDALDLRPHGIDGGGDPLVGGDEEAVAAGGAGLPGEDEVPRLVGDDVVLDHFGR